MSNITKLLSNKGFISCNKHLARLIGLHEALIIGEFCSLYDMYNGAEFYYSSEKLEYETCLSDKQIRNALLHLKAIGIVSITKKGQPCRNYYTLNTEVLDRVIQSEEAESKGELDVPNLPNKNGKICQTSSANSAELLNNKINTSKINNNNICNDNFPSPDDNPFPEDEKFADANLHTHNKKACSSKSEQTFPEKDYSECMSIYYKNRELLSHTQKVTSSVYNVKVYKKRLKQFFLQYGVDKTKLGISNSIHHSWIKTTDYSLNAVLAPTMFDDYIADSRGVSSKSDYQKKREYDFERGNMNTGNRDYTV